MTEVVEIVDQQQPGKRSGWHVLPLKKKVPSQNTKMVSPTGTAKKFFAFANLKRDDDKLVGDRTTPKKPIPNEELQRRRGCPSPDSVLDVLAFMPTEGTNGDGDDSDDEDSCSAFQDTISRSVRFADEEGLPLTQVRLIETEQGTQSRVVVLLMSPSERIFEFLHAEYPRDESTTARDFLQQLPKICSNPIFRFKNFITLARTRNQDLLDDSIPLKDCCLNEGELLLAILEGYTVHEMASFALPLLVNGRIQKAVKHAKRTGRGLKTVLSGEEWRQRMAEESTHPKSDDGFEPDNTISDNNSNNSRKEVKRTAENREMEESKEVDGSDSRTGLDIMENVPEINLENYPILPKNNQKGGSIRAMVQAHYGEKPSCKEMNNYQEADPSSPEFDLPELEDESRWKLPELIDFVGGEERADKVIFIIHSVAVASAAGLLLSWV